MKQTILHISKYYAPDEGGIETVAKYLAEGLTDFHNVVVCFSTDGRSCTDVVNGITVHRFAPAFKAFSQDVVLSYYWKLRKVIRECCPDVINVHCPNPFVYPFVMALAPKGCKIALLWHADILSKGLAYSVIKPFETRALRRADLIIATSPNYIHPSSPIYAFREKTKVLPNGIITKSLDLRENDPTRIAQIKEQYQQKPIVLFVGRHVPYKGINLLIEAEQQVKSDCVFLIAGKGPETERLKAQAKSDRIKFLGKVSDDDLRCHLHAADVFAFPSNTKAEAFGVALAEAMYCGCAPVTFTLEGSGVNWLSVKGLTGEEVALGDAHQFAEALDRLLSDNALRTRYAEQARKRVCEKFTEKTAVGLAKNDFLTLLQ